MALKRLLYLAYYLQTMDWKTLRLFLAYASSRTGRSRGALCAEMLRCSLQYNIAPLEYFQFHFYELDETDKSEWAGTGTMYEYQLRMNPTQSRKLLANKYVFLKFYGDFVNHRFASLDELKTDPAVANELLSNASGKIVLKSIDGQCGRGIEVRPTSAFTYRTLVDRLEATGNNLVEEYVNQHDRLNELSSAGLNTIRIITQINATGGIELLGARLRITINSSVDNLAAGNIAAPISLETGRIEGKGTYSDITKESVSHHPVTQTKLIGFQLPYFSEAVEMAKQAALLTTANRSVGWDIAITQRGPELIEGNHDWCKLLWQLPVKQGLKPLLAPVSTR